MTKLFGIPMGTLAGLLLAALAIVLVGVGILALRNRVFFRLGVRSVRRRPARSALIVTGLMLGTAIIAAALTTGDTMGQTIRSSALTSLGQTDEIVAAKGVQMTGMNTQAGSSTGMRYFPEGYVRRVDHAVAGSNLVDGVAPAIIESAAMQDATSRQTEPNVTLFATDPRKMGGFGSITSAGRVVSLADLGATSVYLNQAASDKLSARPGDLVRIYAGHSSTAVRVRAVVHYAGTGTHEAAVLTTIPEAQRLLGKADEIKQILVSNRGGTTSGAALTNQVVRLLKPTLAPLGLQANKTKQDALKQANAMGASFMSFFTTFGSFSIAAGILLIFLIFVMLAAERRGELGIARAVGTRRRHVVQMFTFEGLAYSLLAAALGAVVGVVIAYGMVLLMASAFSATSDFQITYSVDLRSVLVAYGIGVLLTFAVVAVSAWRVSRMNIVTAIRNLPEPEGAAREKRRWLPGVLGLLLGLLILFQGVKATNVVPFALGGSIVILSLAPLSRLFGIRDRVSRTTCGIALVAFNVFPVGRWVFGNPKSDFSVFIVSGLMIVVGATWVLMYNADVLLRGAAAALGRFRSLAPVLKMSIAYPLRSVFRTGVTLAMFMLVVFTLVVGAIVTTSYVNAFNDIKSYGGGFDVRASVSPAAPIIDMRAALRHARGINPRDFRVVSSQSTLPVKANQVGTKPQDYLVRGLDAAFLRHTTYGLSAHAKGFGSAAAVWHALRTRPGLAVVDASVVPRRSTFVGTVVPKFRLHGFYLEDKTFAPIFVTVRDPQSGKHLRLKVIGVLAETAPADMVGVFTSQATLSHVFGARVRPTSYLFALKKGVNPTSTAKALESAFLANGMQADALSKLLRDNVAGQLTFDRLIMGFMGLGLVVGVAALGVISARAVVERRQQIGVLRAIGFRRRMVQLTFLIESSFIAVTAIVIGTLLGLAVAYNAILDSRRSPSWSHLSFDVPWITLAVIFVVVYAVAMATTLVPARRASRIYPAQALRYQ